MDAISTTRRLTLTGFVCLLALVAGCRAPHADRSGPPRPATGADPVAAGSMAPTSPAEPRGVAWGMPARVRPGETRVPVRTRIRLVSAPEDPDPVVDVGEPLAVLYETQNGSDQAYELWQRGFWPNHRVLVRTPDGPAASTDLGGQRLRAFAHRDGPRGGQAHTLEPGAIDRSEAPFDPRETHDLTSPGAYRLQVEYDDEGLFVASNVLRLWLLPAGAGSVFRRLVTARTHGCPDVAAPGDAVPGPPSADACAARLREEERALDALGVGVAVDPQTGHLRPVLR